MASRVEQEDSAAYPFKSLGMQVILNPAAIAVMTHGRGLDFLRPERRPGSNRRVEGGLEQGIRHVWISKVLWRKSWTES